MRRLLNSTSGERRRSERHESCLTACFDLALKAKEKVARYRQRVALQMDVKTNTEEDRLDDDPYLFKLKAAAPALHTLNSDQAPDPTQLSGTIVHTN